MSQKKRENTKILFFVYPVEYENRDAVATQIESRKKGIFGIFRKSFDEIIQEYRDKGYIVVWGLYEIPNITSRSKTLTLLRVDKRDIFFLMPITFEEVQAYSIEKLDSKLLSFLPEFPKDVIICGNIYRQSVEMIKTLFSLTNKESPGEDQRLTLF